MFANRSLDDVVTTSCSGQQQDASFGGGFGGFDTMTSFDNDVQVWCVLIYITFYVERSVNLFDTATECIFKSSRFYQ